jgi:hypothetical protein
MDLGTHEPAIVSAQELARHASSRSRSTTWKSCCFTVDKRAALFFSQLTVGVVVMGFCIGMLVTYHDCETFSRWGPLLTFVVGVFLPAPHLMA